MTKVYNDLLLAADDGDVTALCLLDLTAVFDTVDHDLLMLRLERAPSSWWTAACVRLTFPDVSACGHKTDVSWSCHDTVTASSVVDRSPLQLRWSGTRFRTLFGTNAEH